MTDDGRWMRDEGAEWGRAGLDASISVTVLPDLETERLTLRRMRMDDVPDVFEYASDPEISRFTLWDAHRSVTDSEEFVSWVVRGYGNPEADGYTWGLVLKESGKLIGTLGIYVNRRHARAEVGYAIGRRYWGRGLTTEAVKAVIQYGFDELGLNRIEARCDPGNVASARVMEKSGMSFEGVLREQMFCKGKFEDLKMYSILRREYYGERD